MSIFPTKILLATDGSREAELAATAAADLAKSTGSELHFVHVGHMPPPSTMSPPAPGRSILICGGRWRSALRKRPGRGSTGRCSG